MNIEVWVILQAQEDYEEEWWSQSGFGFWETLLLGRGTQLRS